MYNDHPWEMARSPWYTGWPLYTGQLYRKYKAAENFGKLTSDRKIQDNRYLQGRYIQQVWLKSSFECLFFRLKSMLKFLLLPLTKGIYKKELSDMLELFHVCYYHSDDTSVTLDSGWDVMNLGSGKSPINLRIVIHTANAAWKIQTNTWHTRLIWNHHLKNCN